ncbi:MAG: GatB/YqeY domain-containing protein [Gammaproteobacteria bacterium]|nr:MAG: GatB/YqeY domain-containing protein [Gammaproteobacteria bacterium]|tara:strand:- start:886 stop:1335 length:450 start_codon:yes stop_codon:yes gene_type:complete
MSEALLSSIQEEVKVSLKSGEKLKASTLRLIVSAIKLEEKNKSETLTDDESLEILVKMIKQRKDSISQFETANRMELAQKEKEEIEIIQNYLPKQLSEDELSVLITEIIKEINAESIKDMGKVMGLLKPKITGKADAGIASGLVKKLLS